MRYLMTHSLLSSWLYAIKEDQFEDETTERDRFTEFMDVLNRVPTQPTQAMQDGIDFEDTVMSFVRGVPDLGGKWDAAANIVASFVRGGLFQYKAKWPATVAGTDFLLYGRLDALKAGEIYDIKFTKNYDRGKYFGSTQHPLYMELVPEARRFTYLVSNGNDVWTESYTRGETRSIFPVIADFTEWLKDYDLFKVYVEKWAAL